jgi:hypothetical protein
MFYTTKFYKIGISILFLWCCNGNVYAQLKQKFGDNSIHISDKTVLELESTNKGFLPPRMTTAQQVAMGTNLPLGLIVYITDGSLSGLQIWKGTVWNHLMGSTLASGQILIGDTSNEAQSILIRGDLNINSSGIAVIASSAITNTKIVDAAVTDQKISSGISKSKVGLSNVQNTADLDKPVSTATQSALNLKLDESTRGAENGVASLTMGKIPSDQIPAISFTSVSVVSSSSAMRALNNIVGSIAIRTDVNKNYVLSQPDASVLVNWIELLTPAPPVQSVNGKMGAILLTKTDLVLNNIDNTSDINKLISTNTKDYVDNQVLTAAADATAATSGKIKLAGDLSGTAIFPQIAVAAITNSKLADYAVTDSKIASGINKSKVGLGNVDNTSDSGKPVSIDTQNALNLKLDITKIGLAYGAASLDASGKIPSIQIPSMPISSVEVFNSQAAMLGSSGGIGTTAIRTDTNKNYILSAADASLVTNWIELSNPAAGIQSVNGKTGSTVLITKSDLSLSDVDNTSDADKPLSNDANQAIDLKENLANKSLDVNMDPESNLKYPSVKAVKRYVDGIIATTAITETTNREAADKSLVLNLGIETTRARAAETLNTIAISDSQSQLNEIKTIENGRILVGNGNNEAIELLLSGDATIDNAGKLSISSNAINNDKILNSSVSYAKIQNVTSNTILGRSTAGEGLVEEITTTGSDTVVLSTSPTLTGTPLAPTAATGTNTTQLATTAFVLSNSDTHYSVNASVPISTRATSDEVVPGMSLQSALGGTYAVTFNAQYEIDPSDRTTQAAADLSTAYTTLLAIASSETIASAIPTRTFTPGVYFVAAAGTAAASVTITLNGSGIYIFKFGAALSMGANVTVVLQGGATASDVFWIAEGAIAIGADSNIKGSLISNSGAVDLASGCSIEGKLLAVKSGAISLSSSTVTNTTSSSALSWDLLSSFAIFSTGGAISNTGNSTVTGDIGTKNGSIATASYSDATVSGKFYTAVIANALATFSVYQNNELIASSTRTRSSTMNTADVALQTIATINAAENIDVRWKCDSGKITLINRVLTVIHVR